MYSVCQSSGISPNSLPEPKESFVFLPLLSFLINCEIFLISLFFSILAFFLLVFSAFLGAILDLSLLAFRLLTGYFYSLFSCSSWLGIICLGSWSFLLFIYSIGIWTPFWCNYYMSLWCNWNMSFCVSLTKFVLSGTN